MLITYKQLQTIRSIGHGILLATMAGGIISVLATAMGRPVPPKVLGDLLFFGGLFASSVTVYLNSGGLFLQGRSRSR